MSSMLTPAPFDRAAAIARRRFLSGARTSTSIAAIVGNRAAGSGDSARSIARRIRRGTPRVPGSAWRSATANAY
jgi:hypothetical protein